MLYCPPVFLSFRIYFAVCIETPSPAPSIAQSRWTQPDRQQQRAHAQWVRHSQFSIKRVLFASWTKQPDGGVQFATTTNIF